MTFLQFLACVGAMTLFILAVFAFRHAVRLIRVSQAHLKLGRDIWWPGIAFHHTAAAPRVIRRLPRERIFTPGFVFGCVVAVVVSATATAVLASPCGSERAQIKLGLDAEAVRIDTEPVDTTIARLVALPRPGRIPEAQRAGDVERTVWRTEAVVVAYQAEDDGDVHIVIADSDGHRMIIELPDPECAAPGAWGSEIREARESFLRLLSARGFPAPGRKLHRTSIPARVGGVGFFDRLHGQGGAAPSGIELHPVLTIEQGGGQ